MRMKMLMVALALLIAVPATSGDQIGTFRPAWNLALTGGLSETHNSYGAVVGGHVSPLRLGPLRFPTFGADVGLVSICYPNENLIGIGGDYCPGIAGVFQLSSGLDIVFDVPDVINGVAEEWALSLAVNRVVLGPMRDSWSISIGIALRFKNVNQ